MGSLSMNVVSQALMSGRLTEWGARGRSKGGSFPERIPAAPGRSKGGLYPEEIQATTGGRTESGTVDVLTLKQVFRMVPTLL